MSTMSNRIIVSACLAGVPCRYNGQAHTNQRVCELVKQGIALPVCPEQLGGLPTPRPACELVFCGKRGYRILTAKGVDYTKNFLSGAEEALKLAKLFKARVAILKSLSPSCGCGSVYNGHFQKMVTEGWGVFANLLREHDFTLHTDEDVEFIDEF